MHEDVEPTPKQELKGLLNHVVIDWIQNEDYFLD